MGLAGGELTNKINAYISEQKERNPNFNKPIEVVEKIIIARQIIKRSTWDDMLTNEKRICIYFRPSRSSRNEILTNEILQVDCHVPAKQDYIADRIASRIVKLLNNKNVNGVYLKFAGGLGELPAIPGFYCAGVRFRYANPTI